MLSINDSEYILFHVNIFPVEIVFELYFDIEFEDKNRVKIYGLHEHNFFLFYVIRRQTSIGHLSSS